MKFPISKSVAHEFEHGFGPSNVDSIQIIARKNGDFVIVVTPANTTPSSIVFDRKAIHDLIGALIEVETESKDAEVEAAKPVAPVAPAKAPKPARKPKANGK
jgi:hypothetical protein